MVNDQSASCPSCGMPVTPAAAMAPPAATMTAQAPAASTAPSQPTPMPQTAVSDNNATANVNSGNEPPTLGELFINWWIAAMKSPSQRYQVPAWFSFAPVAALMVILTLLQLIGSTNITVLGVFSLLFGWILIVYAIIGAMVLATILITGSANFLVVQMKFAQAASMLSPVLVTAMVVRGLAWLVRFWGAFSNALFTISGVIIAVVLMIMMLIPVRYCATLETAPRQRFTLDGFWKWLIGIAILFVLLWIANYVTTAIIAQAQIYVSALTGLGMY
ncbi:hypothetical protein [Bifidobacterium gallicum]|nr:hypothetical protein [Bifidobacterium gallicum]